MDTFASKTNIITKQLRTISEIANIRFGLYEKPKDTGSIAYLQAKDFSSDGNLSEYIESFLERGKKTDKHELQEGDVLLAAKGFRNFAWTYKSSVGPAIASSMFFVIKPDPGQVLPDYLTTLLNQESMQSHLQSLGAGSSIPSIRRSELEAISIPVPSIPEQRRIVELMELHKKDLRLSKQIIEKKKQMINTTLNQLIHKI
jgi:restriction endonuclease S subunit